MSHEPTEACTRCGGANRLSRCPWPNIANQDGAASDAQAARLAPGMIINEGLCKQLVQEYFRRTQRLSERPAVVLRELMQTTYAQGFAAARRAGQAQ